MIDIGLGSKSGGNLFMEKKGSEPFPITTQQSFVSNRVVVVNGDESRMKPHSYNKDQKGC